MGISDVMSLVIKFGTQPDRGWGSFGEILVRMALLCIPSLSPSSSLEGFSFDLKMRLKAAQLSGGCGCLMHCASIFSRF